MLQLLWFAEVMMASSEQVTHTYITQRILTTYFTKQGWLLYFQCNLLQLNVNYMHYYICY